MPRLVNAIPAYRLHRQSGQAIVSLSGKDHLLGPHGTAASRQEYNRIIAEWIAGGRQAPTPPQDLTISELILRYHTHAQGYYRHLDGTPTGEADNIRLALRPLRKMYGSLPAVELSPLKLKAIREPMIHPAQGEGLARTEINRRILYIRRMFRWAVENELVPANVLHGLQAVAGLKIGRSDARETEPIRPVADEVVNATLVHMPAVVSAMVQLQRLTGARPGEICAMRIGDVDRSTEIWTHRPAGHKTAHHGKKRAIYIGARAQAVLAPFLLKLDATAFVFSPAESMLEMRQRRAEARKTPEGRGNFAGSNRKRKPARTPRPCYDVHSYRRAISRACEIAFPVPEEIAADAAKAKDWRARHSWAPNQLRHSAATDIRRQFGLEAAQHVLGHSTTNMTEIYAEKNQEIARAVAAKIG